MHPLQLFILQSTERSAIALCFVPSLHLEMHLLLSLLLLIRKRGEFFRRVSGRTLTWNSKFGKLPPERPSLLSCSWWRKNSWGAGLLRNLREELSHRVPISSEEESEMGMGEPTILPPEICEAIKRRPNRPNNLQFIKEFDDNQRRKSQILVWMG
jgi:hypothetical protein